MRGGLAWLLALAVSGALVAQEATPARASEDLTKLTLDELIARLPPVGMEWDYARNPYPPWPLVPVAQEFQDRIVRGAELTAEQWKRALLSTGVLRLRERWPITEPFAVSMRAPGWLRYTAIHLDPMNAGLHAAMAGFAGGGGYCGTGAAMEEQEWRYQELGELSPGRQTLTFALHLSCRHPTDLLGKERRSSVPEPPVGVFSPGELAFDVEGVPSLDAALPPRSSPELDAAVRRSLGLRFDADWDGRRYAFLIIDPDVGAGSSLAQVGLSLDVEVVRDGEVEEGLHLFVSAYDTPVRRSSVHSSREQPFDFAALESIPAAVQSNPEARTHWSVRLRGTPRGVCALWFAQAYWNGTILVQLDELIRREHEVAPNKRSGPGFWSTPDQYELPRIETRPRDKR